MDCRPVAMGNSLRKVTTKALLAPFNDDIIEATKPTQFGCGESAGGSQMIFALKLQQECEPGHVLIALDVTNAYNEIQRAAILEAVWKNPKLRPLFYYFLRRYDD